MIQLDAKGTYKTLTDPTQLEFFTSSGWILVAVLDSELSEPFTEFENIPYQMQPTAGSSMYPQLSYQSIPVNKHRSVRQPYFLLRLDEDSVMKQCREEIGALQERLDALAGVEKKLQAQDDAVSKLKQEISVLYDQRTAAAASRDEAEKALREYKAVVADVLAQSNAIIERDKDRRRTAYERLVEGEFDPTTEGVGELRTYVDQQLVNA